MLTFTGHIEGKRRARKIYLTNLMSEWMTEQGQKKMKKKGRQKVKSNQLEKKKKKSALLGNCDELRRQKTRSIKKYQMFELLKLIIPIVINF